MASPSMVQKSGDTLIVRSVVSGDRLYLESGACSVPEEIPVVELSIPNLPVVEQFQPDAPGKKELPQCRIKRNYDCGDCEYYTQNPRHFLSHLRDVHGEKVKIYDCPNCLYASKHFQKLLRHMKMVHGINKSPDTPKVTKKKTKAAPVKVEVEKEEKSENEAQSEQEPADKKGKSELKCLLCDFTASSYNLLTRHERREHLKTKFFPCSKCNYVTHIKARFTKHVKYHSMPMIKCEVCDFHTPYKWNLDRHMKNHGGTGFFYCSACNFTADIKQSLTVHEMNHHIPAVGGGSGAAGGSGGTVAVTRRRNRVGGSDSNPSAPASPRVRQRTRLHPRNKLRSGKPSLENESAIVDAQDELAQITLSTNNKSQNLMDVDFVNEYETNGSNQSSNDYMKANSYDDLKNDWSRDPHCEEPPAKIPKKTPRPIPNLIPLNHQSSNTKNNSSSVPLNLSTITKVNSNTETSDYKNMLDKCESNCLDDSQYDYLSTRGSDESSQQSFPTMAKYALKRKNASIFDKLYKEKLMTASIDNSGLTCKDCGHLSKSLSEHSIHEKICTNSDSRMSQPNVLPSGSGSTRCQYCRHRCKSSSDLIVHLQTCILANRDIESPEVSYDADKIEVPIQPTSEEEASVDDPQVPHPMENVVFVWNSMLQKSDSFDNTGVDAMSPTSADNFDDNEQVNKIVTSTPNNMETEKEKEITNSGKKVFKCPHCSFWASTASRFHVHIVGHLNKKPFECSLCSYKSNWRWDITKHIRLKSVRDPDHSKARVLMTDETGRRNYSKYNRYLTLMQVSDPTADVGASGNRKHREMIRVPDILDSDMQSSLLDDSVKTDELAEIRLQSRPKLDSFEEKVDSKKNKKTTWKCKKCDYRNTSKDALLAHVRKHSKPVAVQPRQEKQINTPNVSEVITTSDVSSISYRCGHCNQVSNWKHVIQRHCRLKHNGDVKVVVGTKINDKISSSNEPQDNVYMKCAKCPFTTTTKNLYESHLKQHTITSESTFKCFRCPYYVKTESELMQHLPLHGISEPEKYVTQTISCKNPSETVQVKRYRCSDCPYESNSKSQFTYHEQFHKANNAPFKCDICNYQVTKRHLLHQHMKVHGVNVSNLVHIESNTGDVSISAVPPKNNDADIPLLWVSFCGEFQKMYKCRSCPFVSLRINNIFDHEKMHSKDYSTNNENVHKCAQCNYACKNVDVYLSHCKVHNDNYAKVFCRVNPSKSDEEQIAQIKDKVNDYVVYKGGVETEENRNAEEDQKFTYDGKQSNKLLYFCSDCPARFLFERELQIHYKFHCVRLPYQCETCSYTARQHSHLLAHSSVHTKDYQQKTKILQTAHCTHPEHTQPKIVAVISDANQVEPLWIVVADFRKIDNSQSYDIIDSTGIDGMGNSKKRLACHQCPAKFFKSAALNYHLTLHGGEGLYKCVQCNYAVKTIGNLAKHEAVHGNVDMRMDYGSGDDSSLKNVPLSGTDLYQHKTKAEKRALSEKLITRPNDHFPPVLQADPQFGLLMHGNPDFIYPTYLKNGRPKEKRYKCHKCPSAFEKREQYKVHLSLHGSKQRYKCELCDYSVKYYANYVQHMRKHQMNADAQAARRNEPNKFRDEPQIPPKSSDTKLAIKSLPRNANKDCSKMSVSDRQVLKLWHRRRSGATGGKDAPDERKIFRCTYCPYTNQRRDALDNHMRRHASVSGTSGNFTCPYCDYAAPQSQFLRDHIKVHFQLPKHLNPDYFTNFEGLTIFVNKLLDRSEGTAKENLFTLDENADVPILKDADPKLYVVPSNGERIL